MKKKIILIAFVVLIIGGIGIYLFLGNTKDKSNTKTNTTTPEVSLSDDVDWSSYNTYNIVLSNESVTIDAEGVYYISGSLTDNQILVNTSGNVKLVLDNVTIKNSKGAAIYVEEAKNTYIELIGENTLEGTVSEDIDAVIYSKDDLFMEGDGTLNLTSNIDGIKSSDDLTIYSGTYNIKSSDEGIQGKDSVTIIAGNFNITSGGDAIKTTNETEKGIITIKGGTFNITSSKDGITSSSDVYIDGGEFTIKTGNGSTQTVKTGDFGMNTTNTDTESMKAIKAVGNIYITSGTFNVNSEDDSIHSNGDIVITDGTFTLSSSDDGVHADGLLEINGGTFTITSSEGLEATYIKINDGNITINASDDGINAANKSTNYSVKVEINGGDIKVKMGSGDTDGIDSNGDIYINGGTINITGNSPFDYDGTAKYSGGTMIVNGTETTQITNQMMGGGQMGPGQGGQSNGQNRMRR